MQAAGRYLRLLGALAKYGLARELAFRGNFLTKVFVEVLWLGILLAFYRTVFAKTAVVASWTEAEYLFFVGCYYTLEALMEVFFLENCNGFADLIRSGDLDFYLLKPIDEQFLISCHGIEWASVPSAVLGAAVMGLSLYQLPWPFDPLRVVVFLVAFVCALGIAYSFLLMLTSTSVWLLRNQSLYEMWWLFTSFMRYPREVFLNSWAWPIGLVFTFVIPILLVSNVPAQSMVKVLEPRLVGFTVLVTAVLLALSRWFFRRALRRYRSASS